MNKDFWERIDRLEELANRATPLKWQNNFDGIACTNLLLAIGEHSQAHILGTITDSDNAEYIAAANPAMIMEMIATFKGRLSFLEHELVEKDIELENTKAELKRLEKEADWLAEKCACQNIKNGCQCGIDKNYRRNEARKAVTETDNA